MLKSYGPPPSGPVADDLPLRFPSRGERLAMRQVPPLPDDCSSYAYARAVSTDLFPGAVMEVVVLVDGKFVAAPVYPSELHLWAKQIAEAMAK